MHPDQKILSLDPSSTIVGWALMAGPGRLVEAGLIMPRSWADRSYERIDSMCRDLRQLLDQTRPVTILIEWTKGKVGRRRHQGQGAGLAVYGAGVGAIARECEDWCRNDWLRHRVIPILENDWTRRVKKRDRQAAVAAEFSQYRIADDPGGDVSDAIGMAQWWFKQNRLFSQDND